MVQMGRTVSMWCQSRIWLAMLPGRKLGSDLTNERNGNECRSTFFATQTRDRVEHGLNRMDRQIIETGEHDHGDAGTCLVDFISIYCMH